MSRKFKIDKTMPKPRNAMAVIARQMRAATFDHKAAERGGDKNHMAEYLAEYDEELDRWGEYDCD